MTEEQPATLALGDTVTVTITKTLPFGAFVTTADGTVGLVRDLQNGSVGDSARIRVDGVDDVMHRFSGVTKN
jgi:hypothetical protein